jgi:hypothetical protein
VLPLKAFQDSGEYHHYPVENTLEDNIAGKDSAKSFALDLIKNENGL